VSGAKTTKVGFFGPPTYFETSPTDFLRLAPDNVAVTQTQMRLDGLNAGAGHTMADFDLRVIERAVPEMISCAQALAASGVDLIVQFGTPFSLIHGDKAREVQQEISRACRVPVIMAGVAMLDALDVFGAERVAVASGYFNDEWNAIFRLKLMMNELQVPYMENWVRQGVLETQAQSDEVAWDFRPEPARAGVLAAAANAQDAPVIFALGGGVRMFGLADELERETGKVVVGADIAIFWRALQHLRLKPRSGAHGRLLGLLN
jgi:maleate cis-trans isomerase